MVDRDSVVDAREVTVRFGRRKIALDGVSVQAGYGILGLLGPNGAGKSTLLSVLASTLHPCAGAVSIAGHDLSTRAGRRAARRHIGWLPQRFDLAGGMTALQTVTYAAWANGCDSGSAHEHAAAALSMVDLSDVATTRVRRLSGGQRQRVGLAAALAHDPPVLLLDEPTVGLDPHQRIRFRSLVREAAARRTVVLATHLLEDIAQVCGRVAVLQHGRITFSGAPSELAELGLHGGDPTDRQVSTALEAGYLQALEVDPRRRDDE